MMGNPWIDTRLTEEEMDFLWACISEENKKDISNTLVGNITKSELLEDKDNWFFKSTLKELTERLFYDDWNNYRKYHIVKKHSLPEFELSSLWVNHQNQHEFNPLPHVHNALYSFVVFMKIPTHWKDQYALPFSTHSRSSCASDFQFVWSRKDRDELIFRNFPLSSEDEGRILFFPATLQHQVYPFYGTEEERITISGNIDFYDPNRPKIREITSSEYKEKEEMLKLLENSVEVTKEELKQM